MCFLRLDTKSLERASMDYEAPLMPCGCILLPPCLHSRALVGQAGMQGEGKALDIWPQLLTRVSGRPEPRLLEHHAGNQRRGPEGPRATGCCWDRSGQQHKV